jgi:hypothetical protein
MLQGNTPRLLAAEGSEATATFSEMDYDCQDTRVFKNSFVRVTLKLRERRRRMTVPGVYIREISHKG